MTANFLYAKLVLDDLLSRDPLPVDLNETQLPTGLLGVFQRFLERLMSDLSRWKNFYRPVLGYLTVSRGSGLSRDHLSNLTRLKPSEVDDALAACLPYIRGDMVAGPFRLYHLSFREYLLTTAKHSIYPEEILM